MKTKNERVRGLGKSAILGDMKKVLAATTIAMKIRGRELEFIFKLAMAAIKSRLVNGDRVAISGFGTFLLSNRKGRLMTQAGGKKINVPDYRVIRFKPAGMLRKVINGKAAASILPIPSDIRIVAAPRKAKRPASKTKKSSSR